MYSSNVLKERRTQFQRCLLKYSEQADKLLHTYGADIKIGQQVFSALQELAFIDSLVSSNAYEPLKIYKMTVHALLNNALRAFELALVPDKETYRRMRNKKENQDKKAKKQFRLALEILLKDIRGSSYERGRAPPEWPFPFEPDYSRSIPFLARANVVFQLRAAGRPMVQRQVPSDGNRRYGYRVN